MFKEKQNIAIYGLSPATQEFIDQQDEQYNIIGLLDGYRQSGTLYGKTIISMEQAIQSKVAAIIVVARPGSRRIIVNRIREMCKEHGIQLYDVYGNDLLEPASQRMNSNAVSGIGKEELLKQIQQSEVISFDIFDTLVTRAVLYPTDVFELVERRIVSKYGSGFAFSKKRREAEQTLSQIGTPTIYEIYRELEKQIDLSEHDLREILEIEWQTEQELMLLRYDMYQIYQYALEQQKKVYLVSDMYYPAKRLKKLLDKLGIVGYEELLVSCDYGTTKGLQLFQVLKDNARAESYLHIGDNYLSDVKGAQCHGIKSAWIRSGIDLYESVSWSEEFAECNNLEDRIKLGMFVSRLFNSPFALSKARLTVHSPEDFGYLFLAPILSQYCKWLYHKLLQNNDSTILLGARDGYLIKRLLNELCSRADKKNINTVYFLISRVSAVNASIVQEQEIVHLSEVDFCGSLRELLETRFALTAKEVAESAYDEEITVEAVLKYKDIIIERALENRNNYLKYINDLGLGDTKLAFFDFVSTGTCHVALEKLMNQKMRGYYFIRVESEEHEKRMLDIISFYEKEEVTEVGGVYEDYFILENILTSPMPSLKGFDTEGNPQYVEEIRTPDEIDFVMKVQEGIVEYLKQYLDIWPNINWEENKRCSEGLLELIHRITMDNDIFSRLVWDDNFYSRKISVKDLM